MSKPFPDDTFLARWLNGELSEAEETELKAREDYSSLQQIVAGASNLDLPSFSEGAAWEKLLAARQANATKKHRRRGFLRVLGWSTAAAILALAAIGYWWWPTDTALITTQVGEQEEGTLPDGSTFVLNAVGALDYESESWAEKRLVQLEGEAFFEVEKGSTFTVQTAKGEIRVLGTSFNVWSRAEELEVVCYSGKVRVQAGRQAEELLVGEKVVLLTDGTLTKTSLPLTPTPSWFRGWTECKGLPLTRVFEELSRQYDLEVQWEEATYRVYDGGFPNDDLEKALYFICNPMGLSYAFNTDKTSVRIFTE